MKNFFHQKSIWDYVMKLIILKLELLKRVNQFSPPRVGHSVSLPNPAHLFASQENANPVWPTTS